VKNLLFTSFFFLIFNSNVFANNVLIFGGTKNTGLEAARILKEQGHQVVAFVRNSSDTTALDSFGIQTVVGDAMDIDSITSAFNYDSFDSVFSFLSGGRTNPEVDSQGNINVFKEAENSGVMRVVLVTVIGAGGTEGVLEERARRFLKPVIDAKTEAENYLISSDLDYTILRPGQLPDGPATGKGILVEDFSVMGRITRGELADLTVKCMNDLSTYRRIYHVVDSEMTGSFSAFD